MAVFTSVPIALPLYSSCTVFCTGSLVPVRQIMFDCFMNAGPRTHLESLRQQMPPRDTRANIFEYLVPVQLTGTSARVIDAQATLAKACVARGLPSLVRDFEFPDLQPPAVARTLLASTF